MKLNVYTILLFLTSCVIMSCRTAAGAETSLAQNEKPLSYTIVIRVRDSEASITQVTNRICQSCCVTGIQIKMNDYFIHPDCEIYVSIPAFSDRQIIMIRNALYAIPGIEIIGLSKN